MRKGFFHMAGITGPSGQPEPGLAAEVEQRMTGAEQHENPAVTNVCEYCGAVGAEPHQPDCELATAIANARPVDSEDEMPEESVSHVMDICPSCGVDLFTESHMLNCPRGKEQKPTNPKDAIGSTKLPIHLVPDTLVSFAALAFLEGATKYGAYNWRAAGIRASIYRSALSRHIAAWWNGEDVDPKTGIPHLANALACIGIILDAEQAGKLNDDRPPRIPLGDTIRDMEGLVKDVIDMHAHMTPHHYTQKEDGR